MGKAAGKTTDQSAEFLPFAKPDIGEEEIVEVVDSMRSGWLTTGPKARQFEEAFAEFLGGDVEAVAVNSGTAALHLALEALGIGPGDKVLVPVFTFTATAEVVRYLGADPVFVDVDPVTLNCTAEQIAPHIDHRTRGMIPVHFAGLPCDMSAILGLAESAGIPVVEDAAHAAPAVSAGRMIGSLDTAATAFSFYATKPIATGEGGMLTTRRKALAQRARVMRLHGIDRDAFDRYAGKGAGWYYEVVAPGFKYNLSDVAAAIGLHQLAKAESSRRRREEIAGVYDEAFAELPLDLPAHAPAEDQHSWHLYVLRLRPEAALSRDRFIQEMSKRGVGTSVHFIPLHRHPYWRDRYHLKDEMFPVANEAFEQVVSIPIYSRMRDQQVDRVVRAVLDILG